MPALAALVPVPVTLHNVFLPVPGPFDVQPPLQACDSPPNMWEHSPMQASVAGPLLSATRPSAISVSLSPPIIRLRYLLGWFPSTRAKQEVGGKSHQVFLSYHLPPPSMLTATHMYRMQQALGPSSKSVLRPSPGQEGFPCLPLNQGTYLAFYPHPHTCGLVFKPRHHETWTDWGFQIPLSTQEV